MSLAPPFRASHEVTPTGIYWTVRDSNGLCLCLGQPKKASERYAAELNLMAEDAAAFERLAEAVRKFQSPGQRDNARDAKRDFEGEMNAMTNRAAMDARKGRRMAALRGRIE